VFLVKVSSLIFCCRSGRKRSLTPEAAEAPEFFLAEKS
jgi:hypothetical protein